jgi:hypothetical protein
MMSGNHQGQAVKLPTPSEVREWVDSINRGWVQELRTFRDDVYMDNLIGVPTLDQQQRNLAIFQQYVLGPLGWTMETLVDYRGKPRGIRVPQLEAWEREQGQDTLLRAQCQRFAPAHLTTEQQVVWQQLFTLNAHLVRSHRGYQQWEQMMEQDWQTAVWRT